MSALGRAVRDGLSPRPRRMDPVWFYDALGSRIFDAICALPWYTITRAEGRLLAAHADAMAAALPAETLLIELGPGNGEKSALLARALTDRHGTVDVGLVDISAGALEVAAARIQEIAGAVPIPFEGRFEAGLDELVARRAGARPVTVLFLGSNLGNFDAAAAKAFLAELRLRLRRGDRLLIGADLVKPADRLVRAYDDPLGVTAAFNRNLLVRLNAELAADFNLDAWDHRAVWNGAAGRVEMHLVSRCAQTVTFGELAWSVRFDAGETIWTESSHKYTPDGLTALVETAGFSLERQWIDEQDLFLDALFRL